MPVNFSKEQINLLEQKTIAIIGVISPTGIPHLTPIWFVEHEKKIYFSTLTSRSKYKFIAKNTSIGINITHPEGHPYISLVGKANIRRKEEFSDYKLVLTELFAKYISPAERETALQKNLANEERVLIEIVPTKIFV